MKKRKLRAKIARLRHENDVLRDQAKGYDAAVQRYRRELEGWRDWAAGCGATDPNANVQHDQDVRNRLDKSRS